MHLLYIPMNRKETLWGLVILAAVVLSSGMIPHTALTLTLYHGLLFLASGLVFRRFLAASARIPLTPLSTVVKFALLGLVFAQLANLLS